ncbi:hypothetical protein [Streptomyces tsukubensis]|uniref:OAA-family lectin sugar binding domain-containing protein n=1 Tax=Streptomyces tsukubensis TaxID=83656 RepID=A0A1V4A2G8_9ACTN|nr:hypothetical protein [Streptomyces tsukubensis]OON73871.1 hypothetical protein B1H18_26825 [Streptomyces tsukubensis]QFR91757.1 hypothetical protein GBW32_00200 [Streptomyces tsukubensis]
MATYETEIHTGGGGWQQDEPLSISLAGRGDVVPANGAPATGTSVTWSGEAGNGSVTFFDNGGSFQGTAQFPGEGPVGYRGTKTD